MVMRPERVVDGGAVHVPQSTGGVRGQAPCVVGPLEGQVVGRGVEAGEVFVMGEHRVAVVEHRVRRGAVDVHGIARPAVAEPDKAEDIVISGDAEGLIVQPETIARSGLSGDGDLAGGDTQGAGDGGIATHIETRWCGPPQARRSSARRRTSPPRSRWYW